MVKESAHSTRDYDSEPSAKPKPSKMLDGEGRGGDLKAREENAAQGIQAWSTRVITGNHKMMWRSCCWPANQPDHPQVSRQQREG